MKVLVICGAVMVVLLVHMVSSIVHRADHAYDAVDQMMQRYGR